MKHILVIILALPALSYSSVEPLENQTFIQHEIVLETTTGRASVGNGLFSLFGSLGYNYTLLPWLQLGGSVGAGYATGGVGFIGHLAVGPTFNWIYDGNLRNALFLSSTLGVDYRSGDSGRAEGLLQLDVGKRFEIFRAIVYRPTVGVHFRTGFNPTLVVTPVAFSIAF